MAFDGRVRHEVIDVGVVLQCGAGCGRIVHQPPEELEGLGLGESDWLDAVGELHLECRGFVVELSNGAIDVALKQRKNGGRGQPLTDRLSRVPQDLVQSCARAFPAPALVDQRQVQIDLVQLSAPFVQKCGPALDRLVRHRVGAGRGLNRIDPPLAQVLIDAAVVVEHP